MELAIDPYFDEFAARFSQYPLEEAIKANSGTVMIGNIVDPLFVGHEFACDISELGTVILEFCRTCQENGRDKRPQFISFTCQQSVISVLIGMYDIFYFDTLNGASLFATEYLHFKRHLADRLPALYRISYERYPELAYRAIETALRYRGEAQMTPEVWLINNDYASALMSRALPAICWHNARRLMNFRQLSSHTERVVPDGSDSSSQ